MKRMGVRDEQSTKMSDAQRTGLIEFNLRPPLGVEAPSGLSPRKTHEFALDASAVGDSKSFYAALSGAIQAAKEKTGAELTQWRDAAASAEGSKEPRKAKDEDDEDGEEDGDEE
ncbi:hypothetical protein BKA62DRAFT_671927 [Auriculariales sp. MPI-PUGE-AT-0066]|nr:hypothetical protein BKA62DRAFT_671927 [Auriculariales sp. MPI-PUGE-AT-0066]